LIVGGGAASARPDWVKSSRDVAGWAQQMLETAKATRFGKIPTKAELDELLRAA
jgi:hypothetical protein